MRNHRVWAIALLLGCAASEPAEPLAAEPGPDEGVACEAFSAQWEEAGPFEALGCRELEGRLDDAAGVRRYAMQLEVDLRVLEPTQIFAAGAVTHKSGPPGEGARYPAGAVVGVRGELLLVEAGSGWQVPSVTAPR